jgi:hypothetical protein
VKLIKLDGRHNLYHKGYRWAFRTWRWSPESNQLEQAVKQLEGWRWDCTFWGKNNGIGRPYYIGMTKESTATMVMLKLN